MALNRWVLIALALLSWAAGRRLAYDDDEFQHARMSKLMGLGQVPHRDFYEHHLPLYHLLHAPHMRDAEGPGPLLRLRAFSTVCFVLSLALGARILQLRTGRCPSAVICWIGLSPIVFLKMLEARPETLSVLLAMISLWLLSGEKPRPGLAGVAAACMVLASQKFLFLGVGLFAVCALEHRMRGLLRFSLWGLVPAILTLAGLILTDSLAPAWDHLVVMNTGWKESFSPAMYGGLLWRTSGAACVVALFGLMQNKESPTRRAALCLLAGAVLGVFMVPIPYRQTFLMLIPGWLLALALGWEGVMDLLPDNIRRRGAVLLALIGILPAAANLREELSYTLDADLQQMKAVAEVTEGPVFDARGLLYDRPHVGFYPWLHHGLMQMLDPDTYSRDTIEALTQDGFPPYLEDYRAQEYPPALQTFLAERYLPTDIQGLHRYGYRLNRSRLMGAGLELELPLAGRWKLEGQGGQLKLNGEAVPSGTELELPSGPCQIQARGFVRNARLILLEAAP